MFQLDNVQLQALAQSPDVSITGQLMHESQQSVVIDEQSGVIIEDTGNMQCVPSNYYHMPGRLFQFFRKQEYLRKISVRMHQINNDPIALPDIEEQVQIAQADVDQELADTIGVNVTDLEPPDERHVILYHDFVRDQRCMAVKQFAFSIQQLSKGCFKMASLEFINGQGSYPDMLMRFNDLMIEKQNLIATSHLRKFPSFSDYESQNYFLNPRHAEVGRCNYCDKRMGITILDANVGSYIGKQLNRHFYSMHDAFPGVFSGFVCPYCEHCHEEERRDVRRHITRVHPGSKMPMNLIPTQLNLQAESIGKQIELWWNDSAEMKEFRPVIRAKRSKTDINIPTLEVRGPIINVSPEGTSYSGASVSGSSMHSGGSPSNVSENEEPQSSSSLNPGGRPPKLRPQRKDN